MNALRVAFRELTGLFIEDGSLALAILAVVLIAGAFAALMPNVPLLAGAVLLLGCLGVLLANVAGARPRR
jgi:hypothetical protein